MEFVEILDEMDDDEKMSEIHKNSEPSLKNKEIIVLDESSCFSMSIDDKTILLDASSSCEQEDFDWLEQLTES